MSDRRKSTRPDPDRTDLPEPPECDAERAANMPDVVTRDFEAPDEVLRATYRVQLREGEAQQLEQLAERIAEARDVLPVPYLRFIGAAAVDLRNIATFLDFWADQGGDGVQRHEIPVAALVMQLAPEVERIGERLMRAVSAAEADS